MPEQNNEPNNMSSVNAQYDISITPEGSSTDEVLVALLNIDNYGKYISNLRNTIPNMQKAMETHFGPNIPSKRKFMEKERGKLFPIKTKQTVDDLVKSLTSKPNLLKYEVKGNSIIFPQKQNPTKETTKNIIKTVLDNAGIKYKVKEIELVETKHNIPLKEETSFKIEPSIAFKIYDILRISFPAIENNHTKTSFFHLLNSKL